MPLYEYIADEDGSKLELIRPMADANKPVTDPEGKGRTFRRAHSTFNGAGRAANAGSALPMAGGCCPCGKPGGGCSSR